MRNHRWVALLIVLTTMLSACGKATLSSSRQEEEFDARRARPDAGPTADAGPGDRDAAVPDGGGGGPVTTSCVMIPAVVGDVFVTVNNTVQVGYYLFSLATGEPIQGAAVRYEIDEAASVDGQLSSATVRTNSEGLASVRVTAGMDAGTIRLLANTDCAAQKEVEITVADLPTGDLQVTFNYPQQQVYAVSPVEVRLYLNDTVRCQDMFRNRQPPLTTGSASNTNASVLFTGLMAEQQYTIVAIGFGQWGEQAAYGCADAVTLQEDMRTEKRVDMLLQPLDPVGDYDVRSKWNFQDALEASGPIGQTINQIIGIFQNPGRGLVQFIVDQVANYFGGIVGFVIDTFLNITGLRGVIETFINDIVASNPLLRDIQRIGLDLAQIVTELEMVSRLTIGKIGNDYVVFGIDTWRGIALYWRLNCGPGSPPDCGRNEILVDQMNLGILRGEWQGRVQGYNRLDIGAYPLDFNYGRLILFVLEHWVFPALTGRPAPVTLENLVQSIVNCPGLGDFVAGGNGNCRCVLGACLCDTDVENFCNGFISLVFGGVIRGIVDSLNFGALINVVGGRCELVNENADLAVERLVDGAYNGTINMGQTAAGFTATFEGIRVGYVPPPGP